MAGSSGGEPTLEEVLAVARAHSTIVAARWAGWSRSRVVHARQVHDGYKRGRGHPSREELAREAPRSLCRCRFCRDLRTWAVAVEEAEAEAERRRQAEALERAEQARLRRLQVEEPAEWEARGLCVGKPNAWWFPPLLGSREAWTDEQAPGLALCRSCPVREECLEAALARREEHGVWGGTCPFVRRRMLKRRAADLAAVPDLT